MLKLQVYNSQNHQNLATDITKTNRINGMGAQFRPIVLESFSFLLCLVRSQDIFGVYGDVQVICLIGDFLVFSVLCPFVPLFLLCMGGIPVTMPIQ